MTVQELIDALGKFSPSLEVVCLENYPQEIYDIDSAYWNNSIDQWVDVDDGIKFIGGEEVVRILV